VGAWGAERAGVRGALRAGPPRETAGLSERRGGRSASGPPRGMWGRRSCGGKQKKKGPATERGSDTSSFEPGGAGEKPRSSGDARAARKGSRFLASLGMTGEACHPEPCAAGRRICWFEPASAPAPARRRSLASLGTAAQAAVPRAEGPRNLTFLKCLPRGAPTSQSPRFARDGRSPAARGMTG
jgi:hypothetical protein